MLVELNEKLDRLTKVVDRLVAGQKQDEKWRVIFRKQMNALIRARYIGSDFTEPHALEARRFRLRSQNEEDGIILELLRTAGIVTRKFVEIGCGGTGGNSAVLAYELGWSGLMIDSNSRAARAATQLFRANHGVSVMRKVVTSEIVNKLIEKSGISGEIDFLSIDVDSIDYWILDAIEVVTPRVLVMEYNAHFGPVRAVTVPNRPIPQGSPKGYAGASLAAIDACAQRKGYRLVLCEDAGVNAFFVRADLATSVPTLSPADAWRPLESKYRAGLREKDVYKEIAERGLPLLDV
jgi:hypothetical protein